MINKIYGNVVLVHLGEINPEDYKVGDYCETYTPVSFEKFDGKVTLKNQQG